MSTPSRSGVFSGDADERVQLFTESVSFDARLYAHDVTASIAHAQMLAKQSVISKQECSQICDALREIQADIAAGNFEFRKELEDIHMHIERSLIDRIGDVGRKLHTGRSRNDQVSTDLRLYCRDAIDELVEALRGLQGAFVGRCEEDKGAILPAYTHLQRAQPVLAAHYWLAYCEKFERDIGRMLDCRARLNQCPLGGAAVAGTSLPLDRNAVAAQLGFEGVAANSMDISNDRDFAIELCADLAVVAVHLSGWAEEWILWSTTEFGFLKCPETFCTGSSIMPQKINPDVLELIRGKTARVCGNVQSLLTLVKGLPLAYNRDLQEDKLPLFDSLDTIQACLALATPLVAGAQLQRDVIGARLEQGYLDATTLMEYLIQRNLPQRTAHHLVGELVRMAMASGRALSELPLEEFQKLDSQVDASVYDVLGVENALRAFRSFGSTAPDRVAAQVEAWQRRLDLPGPT